tara:strand:+ start:308 stop:712 length:405 start_codon:yes stop_codon:yes gene_type:complete
MDDTLTVEQYNKLYKVITKCLSIEFDEPYWFIDDDSDYCYKCANKKIESTPNLELDGGYSGEVDSPPFCDICSTPLSYTFTDYGAEEELKFFEENGIDLENNVNKYSLARIAGGYPIGHQVRLYNVIRKNSYGC